MANGSGRKETELVTEKHRIRGLGAANETLNIAMAEHYPVVRQETDARKSRR